MLNKMNFEASNIAMPIKIRRRFNFSETNPSQIEEKIAYVKLDRQTPYSAL
jgi:hypothetical protein